VAGRYHCRCWLPVPITYYTGTFQGLNLTQGMFNLDSGVRAGVRVFLFFSLFFFLFPFFSFEWQEDLARFGYRPDLHFKNPFFNILATCWNML